MAQSSLWSELRATMAQRRWLVAAPVAGVLALGLGAAAMARLPPAAPAGGGGEALRIEVVQPPAPQIDEGPRMGVGELVDGYRHVAAAPRPSPSDDLLAWLEPLPEPPPPRPQRYREAAVITPAAPQPGPPERPVDRYGFDAPQPDYAAARAARRERLDRIERERERERAQFAYRREQPPWRRVRPPAEPEWRPVAELPRESVFY